MIIRMKTITILLTKYSDIFSKFISLISKGSYTHASISIDENEDIFYSFNYKGFAIEKPKIKKHKKILKDCLKIKIQVPEYIYKSIKQKINTFFEKKEEWSYARLGVILCLLHIPYKFEKHYFCSQFVAEILKETGAINLNKKSELCLPYHLIDIDCLYSSKQFIYNVI